MASKKRTKSKSKIKKPGMKEKVQLKKPSTAEERREISAKKAMTGPYRVNEIEARFLAEIEERERQNKGRRR